MNIEVHSSVEEEKLEANFNYPGCFKKTIAFFVDQIIITIVGSALLFPFSNFISSLYLHAWLPGYLVGAIYFMIVESSIFKSQSIGKMLFSIEVKTIENKALPPSISLCRYLFLTLPFYNGAISNLLATSIGITNGKVGGTIFLIIVGLVISGNSVFMIFHPQKRGLHDILFKSIVLPAKSDQLPAITSFTLKPLLGGIVSFIILGCIFGNLLFTAGKDPDFGDVIALYERIRKESANDNLTVRYHAFIKDGEQKSLSIVVYAPIPYDKFDETNYIDNLSGELFPLVKGTNTNNKVDTITIVVQTQKYFGLIPFRKSQSTSKKISEMDGVPTSVLPGPN